MVYRHSRLNGTWRRQWNLGGNIGRNRLAHIPLTHAIAPPSFDQIEMNVSFVIGVRAGTKHRGESMANAVAHILAEFLCNRHIGQGERATIRKNESAHVERVALAMFAELGAGDAVAAATFEVIVGFDRAQRSAELVHARRRFITQPGRDRFRKWTAQKWRRLEI